MKETPRSLRFYFGLVAAFGLYRGVAPFFHHGYPPMALVWAAVTVLFAVIYALIVILFDVFLLSYPGFIRGVLYANMAFSILGFVLTIHFGIKALALIQLIVSVFIFVYLVMSVTRLSDEGESIEP